MSFEWTLAGALVSTLVLLLAGFLNARRGLSGLSLIPWDYVMIVAAIVLIACLGHLAVLWRDGQSI